MMIGFVEELSPNIDYSYFDPLLFSSYFRAKKADNYEKWQAGGEAWLALVVATGTNKLATTFTYNSTRPGQAVW